MRAYVCVNPGSERLLAALEILRRALKVYLVLYSVTGNHAVCVKYRYLSFKVQRASYA